MELTRPRPPPYLEEHHRGQPSPKQLELILFNHGKELLRRKVLIEDARKLAADLMAPTASESQVKLRDAAWAKRDEAWAKYHRACRDYEKAKQSAGPEQKRQKTKPESVREAEAAAEEEKECTTFVEQSLVEYNQDAAGLAARLKAYIAKEAENPAIDALARSGMCECAGSLGTAATWAMLMWFAARACRKQLGDASLDTMDTAARSAFLLEFFQSLSKLDGEAAAAFEGVSEETLRPLGAIEWPEEVEFDEAQCRKQLERVITRGSRGRTDTLDKEVMRVCRISHVDLRAKNLSEDQKFQLVVDKKRADFVSPLEKISDQVKFFEALVANPDIDLEDVVQLMSTVMFLSHGSAIGTNYHTGVMDVRAVRSVRDAYLAKEAEGKIKDREVFYAPTSRDRDDFTRATAQKFTRKLMKGGVPPEARLAHARLSIIGKADAKTNSESLLTADEVIPIQVLYGAVREVEITEETAHGKIVVAAVLDDDIYHVLCSPGDFAVTNQFTVNCALRLFGRFAPVLALALRQRPSSVLPLKMDEPSDGGFIVGNASGSSIIAQVKSAVHKVIGQMDPILGASVEAAAANKVSDVPARLLAARLASASSSGELPPFIDNADGLPKGFGFDVAAWRDLIKSMPNIDDISKAVGPIGHILCSCPTPPPPPPPPPPPNPTTNVNGVNLGHNWTNQEHVDTGQGQG